MVTQDDASLILSQMQRTASVMLTPDNLGSALLASQQSAITSRHARPDYIGEIIRDFDQRAARAWEAECAAQARLMLTERWRIPAAVYGINQRREWPLSDTDLTELLADCAAQLQAAEGLGRSGHWAYSSSRHGALIAAQDALLTLIA